jgi:hypothetical protein
MRHFMFIDESGEANITNPDPRFNIFVLCGIIFREDHYILFNDHMNAIKMKYFGSHDVVFHSIKMRNFKGIFKIFQDKSILNNFYTDIDELFNNNEYRIISCVVNKEKYKEKYPSKNQAYEDSLMFLCERGLYHIGDGYTDLSFYLCLEKRGKGKDACLKKYYTNFIKYGTTYVGTHKFKTCHNKLHFRDKKENVNGLQFADLCAYPVARKFLSPERIQPTYEILKNKILCGSGGRLTGYGLKHFP